ncbi:MAG: PKD domain-containing protein [Rhizobiaceae bacterium]
MPQSGLGKAGTFFATLVIAGGVGSAITKFVLPKIFPENQLPIATITPSTLTPIAEQKIVLNGFRSNDPEGQELSFIWEIEGETPLQLSNPTAGHVSISFPKEGAYSIILTVSDKGGLTDKDSLILNVQEKTNVAVSSNPEPARSELFQLCIGENINICQNAEVIGNCQNKPNEASMMQAFCQSGFANGATVVTASRSTQSGGQCGYVFHNFWCQRPN